MMLLSFWHLLRKSSIPDKLVPKTLIPFLCAALKVSRRSYVNIRHATEIYFLFTTTVFLASWFSVWIQFTWLDGRRSYTDMRTGPWSQVCRGRTPSSEISFICICILKLNKMMLLHKKRRLTLFLYNFLPFFTLIFSPAPKPYPQRPCKI